LYFHFFLFTIFICTKIGFLVSYFISNLKSIPRASPLLQYKNICNLLFMTPQSAVFNYGYLREHRSSRDCPLVSGSNERYLMKPVEICVATRPKNPSNANIIFCHTFCVCCKLRIELNRNLVSSLHCFLRLTYEERRFSMATRTIFIKQLKTAACHTLEFILWHLRLVSSKCHSRLPVKWRVNRHRHDLCKIYPKKRE